MLYPVELRDRRLALSIARVCIGFHGVLLAIPLMGPSPNAPISEIISVAARAVLARLFFLKLIDDAVAFAVLNRFFFGVEV